MASEKESPCHNQNYYCANDPNFAIICSFFDRFGLACGITYPTFSELQEMIENTQEVTPELVDLHVKLLRKIRRSVAAEKWERALIKFCHSYLCNEEGWELERGGYKKCKVPVRLKILKTLLDAQFDLNSKFKNDINKLTPEELRLEPLGRDKVGQAYWCQFDSAANVRVYKEDQDEESWALVAKDREGLVSLITQLSSGEELLELEIINEDSNSQEVEKPMVDTGQVEQSTSEENTVDSVTSRNETIHNEEDSCKNGVSRSNGLDFVNPQEKDINNDKCDVKVKCDLEEASEKTEKSLQDAQCETTVKCENEKAPTEKSLQDAKCETSIKCENEKAPVETKNCLEDAEYDLKVKSDSEGEGVRGSNNCANVSFKNDREVCSPINSCLKDEVESDQVSGKDLLTISKDIVHYKHDSAPEKNSENVTINEISASHQNLKPDSDETSSEVKDVTEEIKQRSIFKTNISPLFQSKTGQSSSGSKLDQIFSRKLEQSNRLSSLDKNETVQDGQETNLRTKTLADEDSCSQSSTLSTVHEKEANSLCDIQQGKRKADELSDICSKKQCIEDLKPDSLEPEVGEEIEEPVMIIKGEGSGQECDTGNPGKNNDEDVGTQDMNNTSSNKTEITLKKAPCEKSFSEEFLVDQSLNNGISSGNCNKSSQIEDINNTKSSQNPDKDKTKCNNEKIDHENSKNCTESIISKQQEHHNKSIEEQLSDLTGEGLSPKANLECQPNTESEKESLIEVNAKSSEKGIRRKSLDSTDEKDTESVPPEAKKTKVEKDCNEIFGTDDSMPYPSEGNKLDGKEVGSEENVPDVSRLKNVLMVKENVDKKNSSEGTDTVGVVTDVCSNDSSLNKKKCEKVDGSKECAVNEIKKSENGSISNQVEDSSECCQGDKTNNTDSSLNSKEISSVEGKEINLKQSKEAVTANNLEVSSSKPEVITEKRDLEIESQETSKDQTITNLANDDITGKSSKAANEVSECQEKSEVVSDDKDTKEGKGNLSGQLVNKNLVEGEDVNEVQSDSSLKGEDFNATKKKSPLKKSPRPRRKVFTPKSRKRVNKTKATKVNNPENSSIPEARNSSPKPSCDEENNESINEATKDNLSENKEGNSIVGRKRRNSRKNTNTEKESEAEEDITSDKKTNTEVDDEDIGGKRRKVKGKRAPNKALRKGIEEKRNCKSSSEEENLIDENVEKEDNQSPKELKKTSSEKKNQLAKGAKVVKSNQGKAKANLKASKPKKEDAEQISREDTNDDENSDESSKKQTKKPKSKGRHSRAFSGINLDIDLTDTSRSVRQSSRIAQIKIKEQADHKHGEEHRQGTDKSGKKNKKKKDDSEDMGKGTPNKKKKIKKISDDDVPEDEPLSERKKRRKKKRKHPVKAFNERDPWKSSSGSSSDAEEEEEDHFDDIVEEEEELPLAVKSDHEFSPESDLEADEEWKPVRRARTAQKVKDPTEEVEESCKDLDDFACEKCGKKDHPEWILLCDTCNHGWHASCLRPSLMLVPEGDWHCPPCQHATLVKKLQETLKIYDRDTKRRENEELRRKRLAYVGISLDNVLPGGATAGAHLPKEKQSGSESSEASESRSESESEYSDEPVYQLRQRRSGTTSYRFNEFDELINSAIRDEVEGSGAVLPEGVLITTNDAAISKEGDEKPKIDETSAQVETQAQDIQSNATPDVKEKVDKPKKKREDSEDDSSEEEDGSKNEDDEEDDFPRVVPKRTTLSRPGRKKHRKLNSLDDPSDDDDDDEDFKGSSSEEEEEDEEEDDSDESGVGRRKSRRGNMEPVRRSSRARKSRFDKEFINDDSEESDAPRCKKTKKLWSESGSESDDSTWGRRKKKKGYSSSRGKRFKKNKKFTIEDELSDLESSRTPKKKRQRKIKYGGLDDLAVEELPSRRTRGKKINYLEVIGTDSDEDIMKSKSFKKAVIEDDDEFDAEKEKQEASGGEEEEEDTENEEKTSEEEDDSEDERREVNSSNKIIQNKDNDEDHPKIDQKEEIKPFNEKVNVPPNNVSPPKVTPPKITLPKVVNKDKPPARRGRPPKAMIAPPPERLISEDEQYKAVVSKVATIGHSMSDISGAKAVNVSDYPQKFSETKDFMEPPQPVTPVKIPNSSFDPKLVKRSPPIKIRSGVPVNAGVKSPTLGSPTGDAPFFPVKSPNSGPIHSPPDMGYPAQRNFGSHNPLSTMKPINVPFVNVKTEGRVDEDDLEDEDLMDEIEEEDEEDFEDESDDDVLEEGEIPKKVARRMARIEERLERKKLAKQMEKLKSVEAGAVSIQPSSAGAAKPALEQKPTSTSQPTQPMLRVVSPLKLMANPPGPLQSNFMNPGLGPRMPIGSPPSTRMPMPMRPSQPTNMSPGAEATSRRGRGRGKKAEKEEMVAPPGGSVIRGMLQQPQPYPPAHYQQQYPRMPYPQQRMPRPPFHPGHPHPMDPSPSGGGPINVKQEPGAQVHMPNKPPAPAPPQPYHPQHRYPAPARPQYSSYPPPPVPGGYGHYGSYPPQPQPYNDQFSEPPAPPPPPQAPPAPAPASKSYSEEEGSGEFGGLVSYFSSQREEDIDT